MKEENLGNFTMDNLLNRISTDTSLRVVVLAHLELNKQFAYSSHEHQQFNDIGFSWFQVIIQVAQQTMYSILV